MLAKFSLFRSATKMVSGDCEIDGGMNPLSKAMFMLL
jgi:hypothetical protein